MRVIKGLETDRLDSLRRAGVVVFLLFVVLMAIFVPPVQAYEIPTTPANSWTASGVTSGAAPTSPAPTTIETGSYFKTTPSGLRVTITVDGAFTAGAPTGTSGSYFGAPTGTSTTGLTPNGVGANPGQFTLSPVLPTSANPIQFGTWFQPCVVSSAASTTCTGMGTIKITFTDPLGQPVKVDNPRIHITRIGGAVGAMELGTGLQINSALSTPGLGISAVAGAATSTFAVTGGNEVLGDPNTATTLATTCTATATSTAGCGTVQVTGRPSTLVLNVKGYRTTAGPNSWAGGLDFYFLDVSFDEDFGGAPTTYEGGGTAAAHLVTDLRLGSGVSVENATTANGTATGASLVAASPNAVAAPAAPGDTNDGVASFPSLLTTNIGATYSVTPTISGASNAGKLCGWIDFDRGGTFTAAEGVCVPFAAGATSVPLSWTVPVATTAGPTYARLRVTYDTNISTASFNGLFSSGEVEDYLVQIKPAVKVVKALVPAADTGTFNLSVNGTNFATAVGNNGTTNFKSVYHTDAPDVTVAANVATAPVAGVVLSETAAGSTVLTDYATTSACTNAAGTAVTVGGTAIAPSITIPQSVTGATANGQAQTITCTLTNSRKPVLTLVKSVVNTGGGTLTTTSFPLTAAGPTTITGLSGAAAVTSAVVSAGTYTLTETSQPSYTPGTWSCTGGTLTGNSLVLLTGQTSTCTITNTFVPAPAMTLSKAAGTPTTSLGALTTATDAGDTITFTYTVNNTGNVTMSNVAPLDAGPKFNGIAGTNALSAFSPPSATVAPGSSQVFTATYILSQTDVNNAAGIANAVTNTATAQGTPPGGSPTSYGSGSATTTIAKTSALTTSKAAGTPTVALGSVSTLTDASDTITYTYTVQNTGNVTLTNVVPTDAGPKFNAIAGSGTLSGYTPASATIAPNGTQVFTATYTLSQADVNNAAGLTNGVTNTATAAGTQPGGATTTSPASNASTTIPKSSSLTTAKSAGTPTIALGTTATATDAGDTITYSYTVTNTGNVTLTNVAPTDAGPKFNALAGTGTLGAFSPTSATIAPGANQIFTATYTLTLADVNNAAGITNGVTNSATASGTQPGGGTTTSPPGTASTTIPEVSTLSTSKAAGTPTIAAGAISTATDAGDTITYTYTVKNTGNVTLFTVKPVDVGPSFDGIAGTGSLSGFTPASTTLAPGATQIFTATYTLSQPDVNRAAGISSAVSNTATSTGTQPDGGTTTSPGATATTTIPESSTLSTTKAAGTPTIALGAVSAATDAGDTITYTYTVKNTGNVTLTGVVPTDAGPKFNAIAGTGVLGAFSPASATLAPNSTQIFTATYTLTQTDVNRAAGITNGVTNAATASGTQPDGGTTTSPSSSASTTIPESSTLTTTKAAGTPTVSAGTNTTATDSGDTITYTYTVKNTGNVSLTGVVPSDVGPKFNGITGTGTLTAFAPTSASVAPGATQLFTATYTLTATDVNNAAGIANAVSNSATASGTQPDGGTTTSPTSTATTTILESGNITTSKAAGTPTIAAGTTATATDAGDTITYTYTVNNTGNVTLTGVVPTDPGPTFNGSARTGTMGAFSPLSATIPAGGQQVFTAVYTLSQGDVNNAAGITSAVANSATASGKTPINTTITSPTSTATTTIPQSSSLTVTKAAGSPTIAAGAVATATDAGDTIAYSYTVKNTGNVSLFIVQPSDTGPTFNGSAGTGSLSAFVPASITIVPGATQVFTATYTLSQADVNNAAGVTNGVVNTATASGKRPDGGTTTSAGSTAQTTILESSSLTTSKAAGTPTVALGASSTQTGPGDTITYTYTVKNTGNVSLTGVVPADAGPKFNNIAGTGTLGAYTPASATLAPNATQIFTAVYTLTQTDVNNGAGISNGVTNTANASGTQPDGGTTTSTNGAASTTIPETSSLSLSKAAGSPTTNLGAQSTITDGGDKITYTYTVTNTGNVTLSSVAPVDAGPTFNSIAGTGTLGAFTPISASLTPGATQIFTAVYTLSQTDVNNAAGITNAVANTANATGTKPGGGTTTAPNSSATTTIAKTASLSLSKSAGTPTIAAGATATQTDAGDTIAYSYTVVNTGNVTLTAVKPTDAGPTFNGAAGTGSLGAFAPATATLAPGATQIFTATYTLSQADVNNAVAITNGVSNTATASGTQPDATTTTSPSSTAKATIAGGPSLTINKSASPATVTALPSTITYTITVVNTGNVTLDGVTLGDVLTQGASTLALTTGPTLASGDTNTNSKIDVGETWTYAATYAVTQANLNAGGSIANAATVDTNQTTPQTSNASTSVGQTPSLSMDKTVQSVTVANGLNATVTDANDIITYQYVVTNTGNVTLTAVKPVDAGPSFNGIAGTAALSGFTPATATIAPGLSQTFTATYTLSQLDVNRAAGLTDAVTNSATATGKSPANADVNSAPDGATATIANNSSVTVVKTGTLNVGGNGRADPGDTITYAFAITNTGITTLTGITVSDVLAGVTVSGGPITLAPGASNNTAITATYTLTQTDIDAGQVLNTATASGKDPRNNTVSGSDGETVNLPKLPSLSIDKTSPVTSFNAVGNQITYNYLVRNTGNTTITTAITVADNVIDAVLPATPVNCPAPPPTGLAPNDTITCTASYTVKQSDIDAGGVTNIASATDGTTTSLTDTVTVPSIKNPAMTMVKTPVTINFTLPGDLVTYDYVVTNTGNTTITAPITVTDNFIPTVNCPALPVGGLKPTQTLTCTGTYTVTQDDLDIGSVTNVASATDGTTTTPPTSATIPVNAQPALTIAKTPGAPTTNLGADGAATDAGDKITYTYAVTNTGNVTLTKGIDVTDDKIGTFSCFAGNLPPSPAPGSTQTCTATYTITQADMDAGAVTNAAFAKTTYGVLVPPTPVTSPPDSKTVTFNKAPQLTVTKSAATLPVTTVGQILTYTINVANTGNQTITTINVTDPLIPALSCTIATLAPGASDNSCTGTYTVRQADIDAGSRANTATATGNSPQGTTVTDDGSLTIPMPASTPSMLVTKTPSVASFDTVGDVIGYTITVKNTGNVTLSNVKITDPLIPALATAPSCTIATLAPGASSSTCSGTYTVTQADLNNNGVPNTATASGKDPFNTTVTQTGSANVPAVQTPAVTLVKDGTLNNAVVLPNTRSDVGDEIAYVFTVKNTGNVTLSNVKVTDPLIPSLACTVTTLAPNVSDNSCTGIYTLTQFDVNAGTRANTATVKATAPGGTVDAVTNTGSNTEPLTSAPAFTLAKVGTLDNTVVLPSGRADVGDVITYVFTVTNTGNQTLTNVKVTDPLIPALSTAPSCTIATLAPGDTDANCTGSYTLTQADVNTGSRANTATASGSPPTGPPLTTTGSETVTLPAAGTLSLVKTGTLNAGSNGRADAGDTITYTFTVQNTGNVTLTNVNITDPIVTVSGGPILSLAPGATDSITFTATYTLTQADVNTGSRLNTATVNATAPGGPVDGVTTTDDEAVPLNAAPTVTIAKAGTLDDAVIAPAGRADVGDVINYTFAVTNTGNVTLSNVKVTDPLIPSLACTVATLLPGDTDASCTGSYTLLQSDVNTGSRANIATVKATAPGGTVDAVTNTDTETVPLTSAPSMTLAKVGTLDDTVVAPSSRADVGDKINYVFTVTNTGNVTLTDVKITDPLIPSLACTITTLAPGATDNSCVGSYTLLQTDVNTGARANTATVKATAPGGSVDGVTTTDDETVPLGSAPAVTLVKAGTLDDTIVAPTGRADVGDKITYAFTVTNTGNVTLTNVNVADPLLPTLSCTIASLAPAAVDTSCSSIYTLTQSDVNAGTRANTAIVTGTPPSGPDVTNTGAKTVPLPSAGSLTLTKVGTLNDAIITPAGRADVGDKITYVFTVKNTGNVTLTDVTVTDPLVTVSGSPIPSLAPGATDSTTFTATYTLTQADINAGTRPNTATVAGDPPTGAPITAIGSETKTLSSAPALTLLKDGTLNDGGDGRADVGDTITYAFTVTNTGNVTLSDVKVTDPLVSVSGGPIVTLAPGAIDTTTFTATYTLTQADIDAGTRANTATVVGTAPGGTTDAVTNTGTNNEPLTGAPAVSIAKAATLDDTVVAPSGRADVGDAINYVFTVTNTGNVTLTNVKVTDPLIPALATAPACTIASLAPGASSNACTGSYTLVQTDVNLGLRANTASVAGKPPTGADVTDSDTATTPLGAAPGVTIAKAATLDDTIVNPSARADVGDKINYIFTVTNTGNVTLTNVKVTDPLIPALSTNPTCTIATLAPAATSAACTGSYVLTQTDINAATVDNTATVTATPPTGPDLTNTSSVSTPLGAAPALTITKAGTLDIAVVAPTTRPDIGDKINYVFTVTNTGNVTLTNVQVTDPLIPALAGNAACTIAALAPGAVDTACTGTYLLTQADLNAGTRANTATVSGAPPTGPPVTNTGSANTPITSAPAIAVVKIGTLNDGGDGRADAGDTISYTFTVTNTGNVTLTNVIVTDPLVTVTGGPLASLDPGVADTATFVATYTLTLADINAGKVQNQATATGKPPAGADVSDVSDEATPGSGPGNDDPTITPLGQSASITVVKTAGAPTTNLGLSTTVTDANDTIDYTFAVTNTGNVTLTTVGVTDTKIAAVNCPVTTLVPAATTNCTGTYTLLQADIDAGQLQNQATASGTPPTGPAVTDLSDEATQGSGAGNDDPTVTPLGQSASISVIKTAGTPTVNLGANATLTDVNDTITYSFNVTNTGNVTLTTVGVTDTKVASISCPATSLAPAASTTCTGTYTLVLADINTGSVTNQATASGTPPIGSPVTDLSDEATPGSGVGNDDPTVTPLNQSASIGVVKTATFNDENSDGSAQLGETITYVFAVRNTGNVTLTSVQLADTVTIPVGGAITLSGGPIATLDPGVTDATTFSGTYTLAATDLAAGKIENTAIATGTPPTGPDVTDTSDSSNPSDGLPAGSFGSGPGSDDPTVVLLNALPILAVDDSATGSYGLNGNPNVFNVLGNDTLGGIPATIATVTIKVDPSTPVPPQLTFDVTTGQVGVVAGTPAGTYTFDYQICETASPNNCSIATATVVVTLSTIVATDNILTTPLDTKDALPNVVNVLNNDTLDGAAIDPAKVTISPVGTLPAGITLNPDGSVDLAKYLATGTYTFSYQICEVANPANCATATVRIPVQKSVPAVSGTVFFDANGNGVLDGNEQPQQGYIVKLLQNGVLVDQTISASDGTYKIAGFAPGSGFQLVFIDPANGVAVGSIDNLTFADDTILSNQNQPIDPSGVMYNSVTGKPVAGVTVTMTTKNGTPLPAVCLLEGQQNQVTSATGRYRFDIVTGADPACPNTATEYRLKVVAPATYHPAPSTKIKPQPGTIDANSCPLDAVPGGACQLSADISQPSPNAPTPYFLAFVLGVGSPDIVNNHIPLDPILVLAPDTFSKTANVGTVRRGETVTYTIAATKVESSPNTIVDIIPPGFSFIDGSATSNGKAVKPTIDGRNLTFAGLTPNASNAISLKLKLVANAAVTTGTHTNIAQFIDPATGKVLAEAKANVEVIPEHVFDCGEIIGKVFDDKNRNGYQDDGEPGLPGARVATVKGLLITTDENGRFHIACADVPDQDIGSNFILKLDTRSLPTGYRVTTENPRTVRLTRGKITKLNFGAAVTRVVKLDLTDKVFASGSSLIDSHTSAVLDELVSVLDKEPSTLRITYYAGGNGTGLAQKRLANVESEFRKKWARRSGRYELPIETRLVGKE